jgi:D-glycero-alpha-D-manno-heptose-7-phosphate kinase
MAEIYERSPTRVDLAGGTLDCWPLYLFLDNPVTVNVAVDIFSHCHLNPRGDKQIELISEDLKQTKIYSDLDVCLRDTAPEFELYRAMLRFYRPTQGVSIRTHSESPVGAGLGGSSSLCISMMKAFNKWLDRRMRAEDMVRTASHIEAQVLLKPTGTQDYFPPIFGGLNAIHYEVPGPRVEVHPIPQAIFEARFLLVYTGKAHHSGINNWQVIKNWLDGHEGTRQALRDLADVSKRMYQAVMAARWNDLPAIFEDEYKYRTALSEGFSSPEIRKLKEIASSKGALAKICGAGGGGCVLIWCPDQQIKEVEDMVRKNGFQPLPARPWEPAMS